MVRRIWFNLKDLKENKRFMDIGPTMAKWPGGIGINFVSKFSQNRFWVMKLYFLGKIRGKNFLTQIWVFGSFFAPPGFSAQPGGWVRGVNFFTKISQNRFWVMKLSFLGKNRGKKFLTQIWVFGSFCRPRGRGGVVRGGVKKIFYWSPAFRICMGCLP